MRDQNKVSRITKDGDSWIRKEYILPLEDLVE